jgi:uncharacterized membrane protein
MGNRILFRAAFAAAALSLSATAASAALTVCNKTDKAVSVSYATVRHHPEGPNEFVANFRGWYGVGPHECRRVLAFLGDNEYHEIEAGLVKVVNGEMKNRNEAMYLYARNDVGGQWNGQHQAHSLSSTAGPDHRRDDSGFNWPDAMNICPPTGQSDPNILSVDFINPYTITCEAGRVPYFVINPRFMVKYELDLQD